MKGISLFGLRLTKGLTKGITLPLEEMKMKVKINVLVWDAKQKSQAVPAFLQKI